MMKNMHENEGPFSEEMTAARRMWLEISAGFGGATTGASLGIFCLGLFFPWANTKGALCGGLTSLGIMGWMLVGTMHAKMDGLIKHPTKPMSVENCPFNVTITPVLESDGYVFPIYKISIFYYSMITCIIAVTVGLIVSFITGPNDPADVNPDLISPVARRFLPKKSEYNIVPMLHIKQ